MQSQTFSNRLLSPFIALLLLAPLSSWSSPVTPGLAVLNVDSGTLRSFAINGTIVGADARAQRLYVLTEDVLYQCAGTTNPSSPTPLVRLVPGAGAEAMKGLCALSPDFGKVAYRGVEFVDDGGGNNALKEGIWAMRVSEEKKARRILDVGGDCDYLAWVSETDIVCGITKILGDNKYSGCVLRINTETAQPKVLFRGNICLSAFALSPDRKQLAFFDQNDTTMAHTLKIVDVESSVVSEPYANPDLAFNELAWSPDGSRLALGDRAGLLVLKLSEKSVTRINSRRKWFSRLYFVTDDRLLAEESTEGRGSWLHMFNPYDSTQLDSVHVDDFYTSISIPEQRAFLFR